MTNNEERKITSIKERYLMDEYEIKNFDYETYLDIHRILFEGLYHYAGVIRNCFLSKGYTNFLSPNKIKKRLVLLLSKMNIESNKIKNHEDFISFISYYFYEINYVHPFEEGNGRTERMFFIKFIEEFNKKIDFGEYKFDFNKLDNETKSSFNVALMLKYMKRDDEWYYSIMQEIISYSPCNIKKR